LFLASWLKHASKQRPLIALAGVVGPVVVLVLGRAFVVGGEVVAATTRVLAGRGGDLDQISVAINQECEETGPAEMHCQPEGAVEPLGELVEGTSFSSIAGYAGASQCDQPLSRWRR
jgi:hypothetical protein